MPAALLSFLIVGAGGAGGAMARYGLTLAAARFIGAPVWGTLLSNLLGCLLMGVLVQLLARSIGVTDSGWLTEQHRLLFGVGFCGAFTTLSALVFEVSVFLERDQLGLAFGYLLITLAGGFACFYLGVSLVRAGFSATGG